MLLRRKMSGLGLERPSNAPTYSFAKADFERTERYAWYVRPEEREKIEDDCLRMGKIPVSAWIVFALNEWIGQPGGIPPSGPPR
jgi:hypothetical protein